MSKTKMSLPDGDNKHINKTSEIINDGEFGTNRFIQADEIDDIVKEVVDEMEILSDKNFVYEQQTSAMVWDFEHNLNKKPSVTVTDSAGTVYEGKVVINDGLRVRLEFNFPFWGYAICN